MLYNRSELESMASAALKGRNLQAFLKQGTSALVGLMQQKPDYWKLFGPYYGVIKKLLIKYQPQFKQPQDWDDVPDYLSHYDFGDDLLNWTAAMSYLSKDGDYLQPIGHPHSIDLPNGTNVLFLPGVGIIE